MNAKIEIGEIPGERFSGAQTPGSVPGGTRPQPTPGSPQVVHW